MNTIPSITAKAFNIERGNYYLFGMEQPGRTYSSPSYRYGFNGMEKDDEIKGSSGTSINFKFRMHDPRLGRFLSVDPISMNYPWNSPYGFTENRVIDGVDLEGLEYLNHRVSRIKVINGKVELKIANLSWLASNAWKAANANPDNWGENAFGVDPTILSFSYSTDQGTAVTASNVNLPVIEGEAKTARLNNTASKLSNPGEDPAKQKMLGTNRATKRQNDRMGAPIGGMKGVKAPMMAKGTLVLNAVTWGLENIGWINQMYENYLIDQDLIEFNKAITDVQKAIDAGSIDVEYLNLIDISDIINVVLQGVNNFGNSALFDIGMKIYDPNYEPAKTPIIVPPTFDPSSAAPTDNTSVSPVND